MAFNKEQFHTILWVFLGIALVVLIILLGPVLMPFIISGILAYILNPLVDRLCRVKWKRWFMPRPLATAIAMIILLSSVLALAFIVIPVVDEKIPLLEDQVPKILDNINEVVTPKLQEYGIPLQVDHISIRDMLSAHFAGGGQKISTAMWSSLRVGGTAVLGLIANLLLIPMLLYYLLVDWHVILKRFHKFIPPRWAKKTMELINETDDLLAQYLRGQLLVMFILAVYYSLALALAGFSVALPVGILTGLLVFIPYIGFGLGLCLAMISAILQVDVLHSLLLVAVVYGIGQVLESFYLTPRLVGERIGLPPLVVIFALLAFGQLFGFIGVLLALPASAIASVCFRHIRSLYYQSRFYTAL